MVEIWPLSMEPSRNDANSSPVSALNVPFCPLAAGIGWERSLGAGEVHLAVRERHLEEGELDGAEFTRRTSWRVLPLVIETFWIKSQTLLYSLVGSQSLAPTWL